MSVVEEKKFVIKHVFKDVMNSVKSKIHWAEPEIHFKIPWKLGFRIDSSFTYYYLECEKSRGSEPWSIEADLDAKFTKTSAEKDSFLKKFSCSNTSDTVNLYTSFFLYETANYLIDGNVTVELNVTIYKMEGIQTENFRNFNDESAKEVSDAVLVVGEQKFYVNKMYLTAHSSYFKSLFLGKFEESGKSEIELNDINPRDFQSFLEVIYGEPAVDEDTYEGILKLADMYDSKTAIRQCEEFLTYRSSRTLTVKFNIAMKYKMDKLTKKCISEMKTVAEIKSVLPEDPSEIGYDVWRKLLDNCIALVGNK